MIRLTAQIFYGVNTIISGDVAPVKKLIAEVFDTDEFLWEKLSEQLADEELEKWLSQRNLSSYIVDIEEYKAVISDTDSDYVMIDIPFSFDEEKAKQDWLDIENKY